MLVTKGAKMISKRQGEILYLHVCHTTRYNVWYKDGCGVMEYKPLFSSLLSFLTTVDVKTKALFLSLETKIIGNTLD